MTTYQILQNSIKLVTVNNTLNYPFLEFETAIKELRTVGLRLPRCSGKSLAARQLAKDTSSFLYCKYRHDGGSPFDYALESQRIRGRRGNGMKLTHLIFDEYDEIPGRVYPFIIDLKVADMLANNFCLVHLYT